MEAKSDFLINVSDRINRCLKTVGSENVSPHQDARIGFVRPTFSQQKVRLKPEDGTSDRLRTGFHRFSGFGADKLAHGVEEMNSLDTNRLTQEVEYTIPVLRIRSNFFPDLDPT